MALTCPNCAAIIPTEDINIATDVAMCRACNTMHKAGELVHDDVVDAAAADVAQALQGPQPRGTTWRDDGQTLLLKAAIGSRTIALFLGVFAAFWTLPALFVGGEAIGRLINGPPPVAPLPAKATEFEREQAAMQSRMQGTMDFGDLVMGGVLLTISGGFWLGAATALLATVTIRVRPDAGTVVKGSFPFKITKQFDPARVTAVTEVVDTNTKVNGKNPTKIVIRAGDEIGFGGFMPEDRRRWVLAILQANLLRRR